MSIRVMTAVWDSDAYEGGTLLVLLALADWAADDGSKVFPKMATLAHKARLSVRGAQVCMARLREDGVIVEVSPARRGKGTEYKIVLDRVKNLHRNECTAKSSGESGDAIGVQSATVGVQSDARHIDNHQEPSVEPSYAREPSPSAWKKIWQAFKTWPGLPAGASEQRAREVWQRLGAELPADLEWRIRAHGTALARDNAARGRAGCALVVHPHNWLERDRGWEVYGQTVLEIGPEWGDRGAMLAREIGAERFSAWFGDALVDLGPPVRIGLRKKFSREYVAANFAGALKRAFGEEVALEVAAA